MEHTNEATIYHLDTRGIERTLIEGHLRMGCSQNLQGECLTLNSAYFMRDGVPFLPVMGEIHFSRYPRGQWEESLLKMKSGGVDIVAAYVFWIHHEETEGVWEWQDNKDVRHFTELCAKHGLRVFLRIGPWCHGECRNGGFPDWIYGQCQARTNDPIYFDYVRKLYARIYAQISSLLFRQGGPIIGIQIENEFMHCGGEGGPEHLLTLKRIAQETGFDVPFYTVTGWGGAPVPEDEFIPVQGGYPDAPWEPGYHRLPPNAMFLFSADVVVDRRIGSDLSGSQPLLPNPFGEVLYDPRRYPLCIAELGPGNQVSWRRRPIIYDSDAMAMALIKVASGANLLGYYMYHGGTNPMGKLGTLEEPGYPPMNYDFQAAIGEYGQTTPKYHLLRRLHMFLRHFGTLLAPMIPVMPGRQPQGPEDTDTLRFMARVSGKSAFLFLSNYQRYIENKPIAAQIRVELEEEALVVGERPFVLPPGATAIWPINLDLDGVLLKYATAQPLARIPSREEPVYFFFALNGIAPEFVFDAGTVQTVSGTRGTFIRQRNRWISTDLQPGTDCVISLTRSSGQRIRICLLSEEQSLQFYVLDAWGQARAFLAGGTLLFDGNALTRARLADPDLAFRVFPELPGIVRCQGEALAGVRDGLFMSYEKRAADKVIVCAAAPVDQEGMARRRWRIGVSKDAFEGVHDVFLRIHYAGDGARLMLDGVLAADDYYYGPVWMVGLKRFAPRILGHEAILEITPLGKNAEIYLEKEAWPDFGSQDNVAELYSIQAVPEYAASFCMDSSS